MHDTANDIGARFLRRYSRSGHLVVELGAANVNGSIRSFAHSKAKYVGIDLAPGPGVDLVAECGSQLPIKPQSADIVVATSVFEHDDFFWSTFIELLRITKNGGLIYINAPSNGDYHRYPNDNWRFYPDAGKMLGKWAERNGYQVCLVESFIADRKADIWNDFVAIFQVQPVSSQHSYLSDEVACRNVWRINGDEPSRFRAESEDKTLIEQARREVRELQASNAKLSYQLERTKTFAAAFADAVDPQYRAAFIYSMNIDDRGLQIEAPTIVPEQITNQPRKVDV